MQRLIFLFDGIVILLFLWIIANIFHVIFVKSVGHKFFWLSNSLKKTDEKQTKGENK
mgnify:CR=1 FL=1